MEFIIDLLSPPLIIKFSTLLLVLRINHNSTTTKTLYGGASCGFMDNSNIKVMGHEELRFN